MNFRTDVAGEGCRLRRGSGLVGLQDRVEAISGTFAVDSPVEAGTSVEVSLPLH